MRCSCIPICTNWLLEVCIPIMLFEYGITVTRVVYYWRKNLDLFGVALFCV